jgi:hypothetical protein
LDDYDFDESDSDDESTDNEGDIFEEVLTFILHTRQHSS